MAELQPYQQRVVDERNELFAKREALQNFMKNENFETIVPEPTDRSLLEEQGKAMNWYLEILNNRIARFINQETVVQDEQK